MAYCGERCISTIEQHVHHAITLRCRSWQCPDCSGLRQRQLIAQASRGAPNKFITITSRRREGISPEAAAKELVRAWRLIRRLWLRTHPGHSLEFIAIFEATKLGWPHLHVLARCAYIDQGWLARQMQRLTDSPVCWIEAIRSTKKMAAYVAKYTAKGPGKFGTLKRYWQSKRYQTSKWEKPKGGTAWITETMGLHEWCRIYRSFGFVVAMVDTHHATASKEGSIWRPSG